VFERAYYYCVINVLAHKKGNTEVAGSGRERA